MCAREEDPIATRGTETVERKRIEVVVSLKWHNIQISGCYQHMMHLCYSSYVTHPPTPPPPPPPHTHPSSPSSAVSDFQLSKRPISLLSLLCKTTYWFRKPAVEENKRKENSTCQQDSLWYHFGQRLSLNGWVIWLRYSVLLLLTRSWLKTNITQEYSHLAATSAQWPTKVNFGVAHRNTERAPFIINPIKF